MSKWFAYCVDQEPAYSIIVSNHPNFVGPDDGFAAGSVLGLGYQDAFNMFSAQGLTTEDAANHATAFVLKDSGVILLRGDGSSTTLKKIGAEIKLDANGNPVLNAGGKKVYVKSDCP